jgi:pimeloyl-ACP methyl ester carboxylesterase
MNEGFDDTHGGKAGRVRDSVVRRRRAKRISPNLTTGYPEQPRETEAHVTSTGSTARPTKQNRRLHPRGAGYCRSVLPAKQGPPHLSTAATNRPHTSALWRVHRASVAGVAGPLTVVTSADGARVAVVDVGQGPPILIVHPGGGTSSSWTRVAGNLSTAFRVLRFDRRPYRVPGGVDPTASMANEVNDVLAIVAAVGEPVLLVGHSSGAVVALEAALADPVGFAGMVLYEPPVAVTRPLGGDALARANQQLQAGHSDRALRTHLADIVGVPRLLITVLRTLRPLWHQVVLYAPGQICDDNELESLGVGIERYARLVVPALLVGGTRSPKHLRVRLDQLAAVLPNVSSVVIFSGQGHLANARAPKRLATVIADFAATVTS